MKNEYLVQVHCKAPEVMRKHWHVVEVEKYEDAIVAVLRKCSKKVLNRFVRMVKGEAYFAVARKNHGQASNVRPNGMPIMTKGYVVNLGAKAA